MSRLVVWCSEFGSKRDHPTTIHRESERRSRALAAEARLQVEALTVPRARILMLEANDGKLLEEALDAVEDGLPETTHEAIA